MEVRNRLHIVKDWDAYHKREFVRYNHLMYQMEQVWCCDNLKEEFGFVDHGKEWGVGTHVTHEHYGDTIGIRRFDFCPFCGEAIKYVLEAVKEDVLKMMEVEEPGRVIPAQVIPPRKVEKWVKEEGEWRS